MVTRGRFFRTDGWVASRKEMRGASGDQVCSWDQEHWNT